MIKLTEALKCSAIPVVIDTDMKIPLDHLISWDDLVIRIPLARIKDLINILTSITPEEILRRRILARNIYNSYFSTSTNQLMTLFATIQHHLSLPLAPMPNYKGNEILHKTLVSNEIQSNNENNDLNHEAPEHKPIYFAQNSYLLWNKIYHPFNYFPTNPFQQKLIQGNEYDFSKLNLSLQSNKNKLFDEEQFTIVILTYKREHSLIALLEKYLELPYLKMILVIWNELETEPSNFFHQKFNSHLMLKKIRIIKSVKNSLNNRFLPYDQIETDAILSLDDDVWLDTDQIVFAFRVWRENRERIVGFPSRYHKWNKSLNSYEYRHESMTRQYSLILTGAAFYHRFYNHAYSFLIDESMRNKIDEMNNCEDISFNMMVSHMTRKSPIKATYKWTSKCEKCQVNESLHTTEVNHYLTRSKCIQELTVLYRYNPLIYTQYRAENTVFINGKRKVNNQTCF